MKKEDIRSYISELSDEINATQRGVAALQKTSVMMMEKLDQILQEYHKRRHVEVGYR